MTDTDDRYEAVAAELEAALEAALHHLREEPRPGALFRACDRALAGVQAAAVTLATQQADALTGQYQAWFLAGRVGTVMERLLEVLHHQTRRERGGRAGDVAKLAAAHAVLLRRTVVTLMEETETDRHLATKISDADKTP